MLFLSWIWSWALLPQSILRVPFTRMWIFAMDSPFCTEPCSPLKALLVCCFFKSKLFLPFQAATISYDQFLLIFMSSLFFIEISSILGFFFHYFSNLAHMFEILAKFGSAPTNLDPTSPIRIWSAAFDSYVNNNLGILITI